MMKELYAPIVERKFAESILPVPIVVTDISSAEMIKYAANAFWRPRSFINEIANICDRVTDVAQGIGLDSRIGNKFLQAASAGWFLLSQGCLRFDSHC